MTNSETIKRTILSLSFFGVLITILMLGESIGPTKATVIVKDGNVIHIPELQQELPTCTENSDCPLPTTYCSNGYCTALQDPQCKCANPQVLRCMERTGRARFLYCTNGCTQTENESICQ